MAEGWTDAVRQQLGLGRLLPLGGPADGAWITERAASEVLRRAATRLDDVRLGRLRIGLADPAKAATPAVPRPASALPPGPLRIDADFAAWTRLPLPESAERLRETLLGAAEHSLGLETTAVDLRVTDLLEVSHAAEGMREPEAAGEAEADRSRGAEPGPYGHVADAVTAVPGVTRLAPVLGRPARPVRIQDEDAPERRHVEVQLAVAASHRALEVARAVRAAVTAAAAADTAAPVTVAVVVTAVEQP
ncbi:nucleopolyhedrovirus P10 family protein [Streptomyces sp. 8N616]|uniref:nucleopolyhedrovirus P10 family protein n=1 Tax=Streptomyces sp. 8N616 TaxID=3457414 RepID=UPI003FD6BC16